MGLWLQSFTSAADAFDLCWKMQHSIKFLSGGFAPRHPHIKQSAPVTFDVALIW